MKAEKQERGVLSGILAQSAVRAAALGPRRGQLERDAGAARPAPPFAAVLRGPDVVIIAEVKRRSPSSGAIRADADAADLARRYARAGAAAISVLTEPVHFGGSLEDLAAVAALGVPTLRKDFIIDEAQLLEARVAGASAALLIVRALTPRRLTELLSFAQQTGLESLVEVHDAGELEVALGAGAEIIGVNARDLETLAMDAARAEDVLRRVPPDVIAVAESGMRTRVDVERVAAAGADAVLVGTALASSPDPGRALAALLHVRRCARALVRP